MFDLILLKKEMALVFETKWIPKLLVYLCAYYQCLMGKKLNFWEKNISLLILLVFLSSYLFFYRDIIFFISDRKV